MSPSEATLEAEGDRPRFSCSTFDPRRRGRYVLPSLGVATHGRFRPRPHARRVARGAEPCSSIRATSRFDELPLPMGRRYQPGGIPLASEVGDSLEFVGTREYREGDPLRKIHWRSWARRGEPVVKEYQEEYFSRIALVLDTFLPAPAPARARALRGRDLGARVARRPLQPQRGGRRHPGGGARPLRGEHRAKPRLARQRPRRARVPRALERAALRVDRARARRAARAGLTTVVAVMLEWDEARETFLRQVRAMGVATRVILVHEGATRLPWSGVERVRRDLAALACRGRGAARGRGVRVKRVSPSGPRVAHAVALAAAPSALALTIAGPGALRGAAAARRPGRAAPALPGVDVRAGGAGHVCCRAA